MKKVYALHLGKRLNLLTLNFDNFRLLNLTKDFVLIKHLDSMFIVFDFGCIVIWKNGNIDLIKNFIKTFLTSFELSEYYVFAEASRFSLLIDKLEVCISEGYLELIAISYSIAFSEKINFFEKTIDYFSRKLVDVTTKTKQVGYFPSSESEIIKDINVLFRERLQMHAFVFLPVFIWENDRNEIMYKAYTRISKDLEIDSRVEILESKINVINDFYTTFLSHVTNRKSHRVEVLILILIVVETVVSILHYVRYT